MGTSTEQVRPPEPTLVRLSEVPAPVVEDFYVRILQATFPPDELEPLESLQESLGETGDGLLALDADGGVVGGLVHEHYVDGAVQLLAYLAVDPAGRAHGLGSRLVREAVTASTATLVLGEIEDPRSWPVTPTNDPPARLRFWDRNGFRLLPLPYVQPALRPGLRRVRDLLLIALPSRGEDTAETVPGPLVAAFLREYFAASEGRADPADPDLARLLAACDVERLPLWPLDRLDVVG
ncbi:GNAT family N-acetyltransferase [Cellulomonas algicola]|uniref:GNAT family N-acetyltransferase n=1 Tax=Cellulomonas algicola TaxID=2071633 RepID=UPI001C3F6535|nr:GNAT family N-acetyltransferase [Cellulomonas algicola]